jgi:uncharacterized protein YkwD
MFIERSLFIVAVLLASGAPKSFASKNDPPVFQEEILKKMNELRARHGVLPLKLNPALNQYAEERANAVSEKGGLRAGHAGLKPGYGENLYWSWSTGTVMFSGTAAAESWYAEQKDYKADEKNTPSAERFTQMIWKGTTEVGCARLGKPESTYFSTYIVCVFSPPGNVAGQFAMNVPPVSAVVPVKLSSRKKKQS